MLQLKLAAIFLFFLYLIKSCASASLPPTQPGNANENVAQNLNAVGNTTSAANSDSNQANYPDEKISSPRQSTPRRQTIKFPDDCDYFAGTGNENQLRAACADAIRKVQPDLPKEKCGYLNFKDVYGKDGYYDLNEFSSPKIHPDAILFYPLSSNKYLVQIYCDSGAYNTANVYLLYDESALPAKAEVLKFPYIMSDERVFQDFSDLNPPSDDYIAENAKLIDKEILYGINFNLKTKKLIVYVRGNGMGEFGQYTRYSFPNDKPKLEEFRAQYYWRKNSPVYSPEDMTKHPPTTWKKYYPR